MSNLIDKNKNIFVKFIYQDVKYSGVIFKVIQDNKKHKYALYIDINLLQRMTKIRHLKKMTDLKDNPITETDLENKVGIITSEFDDLFNFEAREFIDPYKKSLNEIVEIFEKKRNENFNSFKLENII